MNETRFCPKKKSRPQYISAQTISTLFDAMDEREISRWFSDVRAFMDVPVSYYMIFSLYVVVGICLPDYSVCWLAPSPIQSCRSLQGCKDRQLCMGDCIFVVVESWVILRVRFEEWKLVKTKFWIYKLWSYVKDYTSGLAFCVLWK